MTAPASQDPLIAMIPDQGGQRLLGPCRLLNRVGGGPFGPVYKAHHTKLKIDVALRVLAPQLAADAGVVSRFVRESMLAMRIRHPNLAEIHDVDSAHGLHYIVFEWIEGHSAEDELRQVPKLSPAQALRAVHQAALGLGAAHEKEFSHRGFRPGSIQLGLNGEIKIVDLGLARALHDSAAGGAPLHSPAFTAPEQCQDPTLNGPAADVYSLGATLFNLLTGRPPYEGKTLFDLMSQIVAKPFPALPGDLAASAGLSAVLAKATAKNPADRYADAGQFAAALEPEVQAAPAANPAAGGVSAKPPPSAPARGFGSNAVSTAKPPAAAARPSRMAFESGSPQPAVPATPAAAAATTATATGQPADPWSGVGGPPSAAPAGELTGDQVWEEAKQAERQGDPEKSWALLDAGAKRLPGHFEVNYRAADLVLKMKWKDRFDVATGYAQIATDLGQKDRDQSYNSRRVLAGLQALKRSLEQFEKYIQLADQHYRELRIDQMKQPVGEAENLQPKHADMERVKIQFDAGKRFEDNYAQWLQMVGNEQWAEALVPMQQMDAITVSHPNPAVPKAFAVVRQLTQALAALVPVSPDGGFVMELSHLSKPALLLAKIDAFRQQAVTTALKRLRDFLQNNGDLAVARKTLAGLRHWADKSDRRLNAFDEWFALVEQSRAGRAPGELIVRLTGYGSWVHLCGFASDGSVLATASDDHKVYLHDIPAGTIKQEIDIGKKNHATVLEISGAQRAAAVGLSNGELHQYDLDTGGEVARQAGGGGLGRLFGLGGGRCFYPGHSAEIAQVRFSPDGLKLLSAAQDKTIRLWDAFNGQELKRFNDCKQPPVGLDYDPTGAVACAADDKGAVFVFDLESGATRLQFNTNKPLKKALFTAAHAILLDTAGKVSLWDLSQGKHTADVAIKGAQVQDMVLSPQRDVFVTIGRETVARLWRAQTGQAIHELAGHAAALRSAVFSDNGRWLITYGMQGEVRVWDAAEAATMYVLKGHTGLVLKACFSTNSRWIATVSEDKSTRVWSAGLPPDAPQV